jgi:DNA-directed RNA polymerase specialized sigma24 family protein
MRGKRHGKVTANSEYASLDEAAVALEQLGPADRIRLQQLARNRLYGLNTQWEDLLQEALTRILEGTRKWPRNVPIIAFIAGVMKSLASEYWQQQHQIRSHIQTSPPVSTEPGIERAAAAKAELQAIEAYFGDDDEGWVVAIARADGCSPEEIQAMFNFTSTEYDSTLKRIRRKINQYKRKGAEQ